MKFYRNYASRFAEHITVDNHLNIHVVGPLGAAEVPHCIIRFTFSYTKLLSWLSESLVYRLHFFLHILGGVILIWGGSDVFGETTSIITIELHLR